MSDFGRSWRVEGPEIIVAAVMSVLAAAPSAFGPQASSSAQGGSGPVFEVASVKPSKSDDNRIMLGMQPGDRFTATNVPLRLLIRNAYQLQDFQIVGGPDWISSDRFDISAKGDGAADATPLTMAERTRSMQQALLAERFKLATHREAREMPIYALVPSRADGRLGPKMQKATVDCAALMAAARGRGAAPPPGPPPGPPQPGQRPPCSMMMGFGRLNAGSVSMSQLVTALSPQVSRTVVDQTGLTGAFDIDLEWTPEQLPQRAPGTPADQPVRINGADIDPNGPSIFTALQEQLGLKLESRRGPVDVLVIDHVEKPSPD